MMCAQSTLTGCHLIACSHNFWRRQRAEGLHSRAFVTSNCYRFLYCPFLTKKWYFNSLIFFLRISKTSLKGKDTMTFLDFPLTATHLEYFMEWFLLLDESDSLVSVLASASSSKFIFIHSHHSFPSSSFP